MAAQFDTARVVLQPTQQEAPAQTNVFEQGAQVAAQLSSVAQQDAGQQANRMSQLYAQAINGASAGFDRVLAEYNKIAEENGARDATGIIKRDGNKQLIPPSSFYPPGISTRAYAESFRKNAEATYRQSAEADYQDYASIKMQEHSGDLPAFSAAMATKRDAMLTGLDERFAPFLSVRMEQIDGRAASQIAVRLQSETNLVNKQGAEEALTSLNSEAARLGNFAEKARQNALNPEHLDQIGQELLVNNSVLNQKWADYETRARSAGVSQAQIDRNKRELGFNAWLHTAVSGMRDLGFDDGKGNVDPDKVATYRGEARSVAKLFPGREERVESALNKGIDYSLQQSQLHAQGVVYREKMAAEPKIRAIQKEALEAQALPPDQWEQKQAIAERHQREAIAMLGDTSLSDSAAMRMSAAYQQAGAISKAALQESFTGRIQSLVTTAGSIEPDVKPEHKAAALAELQTLRDDPALAQHITPGQRNVIQSGIETYIQQQHGMELGAFHAYGLKGELSPSKIDEIRAQQYARGMIRQGDEARIAELDTAMKQAYHNKGTQSRQAAEFVDNFAKGQPSNPDQLAAHKKETAWKPPGGGPTVDWSKPDHVLAVQQHYQKFGYMPDAAKVSFDTMPHSPNEADIAGHKAMLETIRQVERAQIEKQTGKIYDPDQERMLEQNVAGIVGKNYSYLSNAVLHGALAASKVSLDARSKAGNAAQTPDQANASMNAAAQNLAGVLQRTTLNTVSQILAGPLSYLRGDDANLTPEQKAIREATSITPGSGPLDYLLGMTGLTNRGNFEKVIIDPGFSGAIGNRATVHLATDGNAIRTGPNRDDPEGFAYGTAFFSAVRNGEVSATVSADGKTVTYGWKTLGDHVAPALGTKMTKGMEQVFAANILSAERTRIDGNLAVIDPTRTYVRSYQAPNGQLRYFIAEQDRNGNFVKGMDLAKDDPRIGIQALATMKSATQAVVGVSEGTIKPGMYGSAALFALTGPFGAAVTAIDQTTGIPLKWPVEGYLKAGAMIGNTIQQLQVAVNRPGMTEAMLGRGVPLTTEQAEARKNMQTTAVKLLSELDSEMQKIPNAANLKDVLSHMLDNHAPGTDNSALRELIKGSGFYQPGRLPQVQTQPSRIGKEPR